VLVLPIASTVTVNGLEAFDRHAIVQHGTVQVSGAHWLLLAGAPFQQPFENHGPFVMNDRAGLVKAGKDFLAGRMGRLEKLGSLA
jgi:redox-sensitive bicupin YhaK (pirin superfamily)